MINVGNNGEISNIFLCFHTFPVLLYRDGAGSFDVASPLEYDETVRKILPVILLTFVLLFQKVTTAAAAGTFSLSPATGNQTLNSTFNVDVKFDTGSDTVKTIKAYLTFPANLLSVDDVLTVGSSVVTWAERLYSNTNGTLSLSGDVGASGITGSGKLLATIKFKVKANGTAAVKFTSASQMLKLSDNSDVLSLTSSTSGAYTLGTVTITQPAATPSGGTVPQTGNTSPTVGIVLLSIFLIILGILMGRSSFQNSESSKS